MREFKRSKHVVSKREHTHILASLPELGPRGNLSFLYILLPYLHSSISATRIPSKKGSVNKINNYGRKHDMTLQPEYYRLMGMITASTIVTSKHDNTLPIGTISHFGHQMYSQHEGGLITKKKKKT